ncbi:unnamed protein product [Vitrella brassicaformis CCMP3155]|uniref:Sulfite oxidase n=3 Tax=Vitrella brassicaformis TaxID=1169539 RepID=A0A0G4EV47_VITBC|nr:unnamed protein product [Vitrella brassicaformis CCMP3155]|eukprot:CEM02486.1 unnamed protein product [Vitrella brassicaformis CCMP3155]
MGSAGVPTQGKSLYHTIRMPKGDTVFDGTADTPDDKWIKRRPEMVRLTGKHPFNSEPPLTLIKESFYTPQELLYVRTHGDTPQLDEKTHSVKVDGLVSKPLTLSVEQIKQFSKTDISMVMVCAGNRRKEQNMIKQTVGFNWGPTGCGNVIWTGCLLRDVLLHCGVDTEEARHVCFVGADKLAHDHYGTSIPMSKVMDPEGGVLLAWECNGEPLLPDHGYPIRVVMPGYIGGRAVKWLTNISVSKEQSTNYYHYRDNKVYPSHVDQQNVGPEGWWEDNTWCINDLNVNGAITNILHQQTHDISKPLKLSGYAYSGGGHRIIRPEVSIDGGKTWKMATITVEPKTQYGRTYEWSFWETEVQLTPSTEQICFRAWDDAMNVMPDRPNWTLMGMLNNSWYRIQVTKKAANTVELGLPHWAHKDAPNHPLNVLKAPHITDTLGGPTSTTTTTTTPAASASKGGAAPAVAPSVALMGGMAVTCSLAAGLLGFALAQRKTV